MNILLDTHSFYWILTNSRQLSQKARVSFTSAKQIFIPAIVLLELLYLLEKKKENKKFDHILRRLLKDERYVVVSLDTATVQEVVKTSARLEMHDRIIVASAKLLDASLITKDRVIRKYYKHTIW